VEGEGLAVVRFRVVVPAGEDATAGASLIENKNGFNIITKDMGILLLVVVLPKEPR
jgi:hypothetical protein